MGTTGAVVVRFSIPWYADIDFCGVVDSDENTRCHIKILNNCIFLNLMGAMGALGLVSSAFYHCILSVHFLSASYQCILSMHFISALDQSILSVHFSKTLKKMHRNSHYMANAAC